MTRSTWFALLVSAAFPALTAFKYAQYAWAPEWRDDYGLSLLVLYVAQFPVTLLGAAFAECELHRRSGWRRALVYVVAVAIVVALTGLAKIVIPGRRWRRSSGGRSLQLTMLMFVGPQPALALARIDAVTTDAVNLTVLAAYVCLLAIAAGIGYLELTGGIHAAQHPIELTWADLAWLGAIYFALRTWSAVHVYTPAFELRRKGYFERPWIDRAARLWKKSPSREDY
ncbi:MAG: hypothetical protein IPF73_14840 [Betaproteobacteria bacterium]|nr:hypothetical protein [Betaproteobacteria bacterium]